MATSQVHRATVVISQIELELLESDSTAGYIIQYMARMLVHQHTAVHLINRYLGKYTSATSRTQYAKVGERGGVQIYCRRSAHVYSARMIKKEQRWQSQHVCEASKIDVL